MERQEPRRYDDEGLPLPPPARDKASLVVLKILVQGEKIMFVAVAAALLAIAVVFVRGVHDLVVAAPRQQFPVTVTRAVNSVLSIVVILGLVRRFARLERV